MPAPVITAMIKTKAYKSTSKEFRVGQRGFDERGDGYVFVEYDEGSGSVGGTAGLMCARQDISFGNWVVTCDLDDADVLINAPGGELAATLADGEKGWSKIHGLNDFAKLTSGSVTSGAKLKLGTGDGDIAIYNSGVAEPVGTARAADAGTALAAGSMFIDINA